MAAVAASPNLVENHKLFKVNESTEPAFYTCKNKKLGSSECQLEFANANHFAIVSTPKRGDCMYYALTYFGRLCNVPQLFNPHMTLRAIMVDKLLETNYESLGLKKKDIEILRKKGKYDCLAGELPPAFIASVFRVNVKIYRYNDATKQVTLNRYDIVGGNAFPTVHLMHSHAHYRLLISDEQIQYYDLTRTLTSGKYRVSGIISHSRRTTQKKPKPLNNSNMESNTNNTFRKPRSKSRSRSRSKSRSRSRSRSRSKSKNNKMVYSASTSKVYHIFEDDAGSNYDSMPITTAHDLGKTLCKRCEKKQSGTRKSKNNNNAELQEALARSLKL